MKIKTACTLFACSFITLFSVTGCASSGQIKGQTTSTGVTLDRMNYQVIKASAQGESKGFKLLGIIPFKSPSYAEAKSNMYNSLGVSLEGKAIAQVNQTEDRSSMYLILFSMPKLTLNADIIEYIKKEPTIEQ